LIGPNILQQNKKLLDKVYRKLSELKDTPVEDKNIPVPVLDALSDDLNTPQLVAEINRILKEQEGKELKSSLLAIGNLIGLFQQNPENWFSAAEEDVSEDEVQKIETLLAERIEAKENKDFSRADAIRAELLAMKIEIKDTREGTTWEKVD